MRDNMLKNLAKFVRACCAACVASLFYNTDMVK